MQKETLAAVASLPKAARTLVLVRVLRDVLLPQMGQDAHGARLAVVQAVEALEGRAAVAAALSQTEDAMWSAARALDAPSSLAAEAAHHALLGTKPKMVVALRRAAEAQSGGWAAVAAVTKL